MLNRKSLKRSISIFIMSIMATFILTENYIEANAFEKVSNKSLQLEVKVKNKNTATMILKGIKIPDEISVKMLDDPNYNYEYEIQFGDLSVMVLLVPGGKDYGMDYGDYSITLEAFDAVVCSRYSRYRDSMRTFYSGKYDVKWKYTKDSITIDLTIKDPKLDFTKLDFYRVHVEQGMEMLEKDFLARKGKVIPIPKNHMLNMSINYQGRIEHTGKEIKPHISVKDGTKTLKINTDYTVTYKNNKNIGSGEIIIKGKGKYTGYVSRVFDILPKRLKLKSVSKEDDGIKIEWVLDKNATSYGVYYSTEKNRYNRLGTVNDSTQGSYVARRLIDGEFQKGEKYTFYVVSNYEVNEYNNSIQSEFSNGKEIKY